MWQWVPSRFAIRQGCATSQREVKSLFWLFRPLDDRTWGLLCSRLAREEKAVESSTRFKGHYTKFPLSFSLSLSLFPFLWKLCVWNAQTATLPENICHPVTSNSIFTTWRMCVYPFRQPSETWFTHQLHFLFLRHHFGFFSLVCIAKVNFAIDQYHEDTKLDYTRFTLDPIRYWVSPSLNHQVLQLKYIHSNGDFVSIWRRLCISRNIHRPGSLLFYEKLCSKCSWFVGNRSLDAFWPVTQSWCQKFEWYPNEVRLAKYLTFQFLIPPPRCVDAF